MIEIDHTENTLRYFNQVWLILKCIEATIKNTVHMAKDICLQYSMVRMVLV